ncbi:MAG: diacylglycerol kinase family protein [Planctomycetota bacterium]|nr:diacylglycerol kinase family protein [Planctomycetota bacterium]MDG2142529.1 diacylglycerol kinase family protein [Planctomycetota bacterium]
MTSGFPVGDRFKSFGFAFNGLAVLLKTQHNAWLHLMATLIVVALGVALQVSRVEWCLLTLAMSQVWIAEGLNTAIEYLADAVTLEQHPLIGKAKDVAAGAVLLSAVGAAVVGVAVFYPHLGATPS